MSRQVRYRVAAMVLGGLLLGTPLLTNGTANAEQSEAGGRQVVFGGGGMLGLSCRSAPDVSAITVPAESTVRVVNRTGHAAKLRLGGATKGTVPDDGSTEVVFRRGTTAVLLTPSCALGEQSTPLLVTASPSAAAAPDPVPGPDDDNAAPATPSDPESPSSTPDGTVSPDTASPAAGPQRTSTTRPGSAAPTIARPGHPAVMTAPQGMPQGGSASKIKTRITRGTDSAAPTFAGMPPGDDKTIVGGVPTLELPTTSEAAAPAYPPASEVVTAEPVAAMKPLQRTGSVGLLGVVAGICVIGVAFGAIRAIVSQRAYRANMA